MVEPDSREAELALLQGIDLGLVVCKMGDLAGPRIWQDDFSREGANCNGYFVTWSRLKLRRYRGVCTRSEGAGCLVAACCVVGCMSGAARKWGPRGEEYRTRIVPSCLYTTAYL